MMSTIERKNSIGDFRKRQNSRTTEKESETLSKITTKADEDREQRRLKKLEAQKIRQQKIAEERRYSDDDDEGSGSGRGTPVRERPSRVITKPVSSYSSSSTIASNGIEESKPIPERLQELEQKYKDSMVSNAQLHNEKTALFHQVDALKDKIEDTEQIVTELKAEIQRQKSEFHHHKHEQEVLSLEISSLKAQVEFRDNFISEHGLSLPTFGGEEDENNKQPSSLNTSKSDSNSLDRQSLLKKIDELTTELESMKNHQLNPVLEGQNPTDIVRESTKLVSEYKAKLQQSEADNAKLEGTVSRLEGNVKRLKGQVENLEKQEDELINERRKQAREIRRLQQECDELKTDNELLQRRIETLRRRRDRPET
ncbi:leucine-rich repeat flightless-interacting protein 2-like [Dysidea avara]|uniref:leucine-rich repeat flightless-interacting protein 2-like n=1 Tax=Dysidea avara TaxID=196820 RepID=UPI00332FD304